MQFGPTSRMPVDRAISTSAACRAAPSAPASAKPVEMITQHPTPAAAAAATLCTSEAPGTARIATSGGAGPSAIVAYARRPSTSARRGLIGTISPAKPCCTRKLSIRPPSLSLPSEAPTTATDPGSRIRRDGDHSGRGRRRPAQGGRRRADPGAPGASARRCHRRRGARGSADGHDRARGRPRATGDGPHHDLAAGADDGGEARRLRLHAQRRAARLSSRRRLATRWQHALPDGHRHGRRRRERTHHAERRQRRSPRAGHAAADRRPPGRHRRPAPGRRDRDRRAGRQHARSDVRRRQRAARPGLRDREHRSLRRTAAAVAVKGKRIMRSLTLALVLALGAASLTAPASAASRTIGQIIDDAAIVAEVKTKLTADKLSNLTKIDVKSDSGVVTLGATVDSADRRARAAQIAANVNGVKSVLNNIEVSGTGSTASTTAAPASTTAAPASATLEATGTVASVDPATGIITLQDGRVLKATDQTAIWQPSSVTALKPGAQV